MTINFIIVKYILKLCVMYSTVEEFQGDILKLIIEWAWKLSETLLYVLALLCNQLNYSLCCSIQKSIYKRRIY